MTLGELQMIMQDVAHCMNKGMRTPIFESCLREEYGNDDCVLIPPGFVKTPIIFRVSFGCFGRIEMGLVITDNMTTRDVLEGIYHVLPYVNVIIDFSLDCSDQAIRFIKRTFPYAKERLNNVLVRTIHKLEKEEANE